MNAALESMDEMMMEMDRPGAALCTAIAEELRITRGLLEELATVLVADERFVTDYLDQFQAFDLIVQHVDESATLLDRVAEGQGVGPAIDNVRLAVVQQRLRAALG